VRLAKPCRRLCILLAPNTPFKCITAYDTMQLACGCKVEVNLSGTPGLGGTKTAKV